MSSKPVSRPKTLSLPPSLQLSWVDVWSSLPQSPGVYWFLDEKDNVLYVGKAKNLKNRITSYKQWQSTQGKTRRLVFHAKKLKFEVLTSELEALLVEAELIRTHQPQYNILLKDDKTPLYVHITDEKFPRVLTVRKKELEKMSVKGSVFGPFPSAYQLKEVIGVARKIFPFCNAQRGTNYGTPSNTPCFDYHLDLCPGACVGDISPAQYCETVKQLEMFLRGKKKNVVKEIEEEMKKASDAENYEYARDLRDRVQLIRSVTESHYRLKPDVNLPKLKESFRAEGVIYLRRLLSTHFAVPKNYPLTRIEGYDVSNIQGTNAAVAQVTFLNGAPAKEEYRLFNIRTIHTPNDYAMLQEALLRRQNHPEWGVPNVILIDGGKGQLRAALKAWHWTTPVISIAKKPDRIIFPVFAKPSPEGQKSLEGLKYHEVRFEQDHPALTLLQRVRDEAHRFSKKQHTRMRNRAMLE